ncbi:MAG: hypothetical protein Q9217_005995 [Psora testacea]
MELSGPTSNKKRPSNPENEPDIMNDPEYDTNNRRSDKSSDDADTCRICRGEGSQEEPLFYPCRCSGSIKFVHQNCLMEWLSHSQKKHCELCKTPFRFTKLYDAHMPKSVPVPVFLRQAAIHAWKSLLTWSRFHFVAFVWVFWLPWCMRAVWRGLFWIGDGSWVDWRKRSLQDATARIARQEAASSSAHVVPMFHTSREAFASALIAEISSLLSKTWRPVTQVVNFRQEEPLTFRLLKKLHVTFFRKSTVGASSLSEANVTAIAGQIPRSASWLSDIPFLKSLTRSTIINNIIIDTLEGQIITMFLVIAFILIFLIREWVMQQQQNLLMGPDANQGAALRQNPVVQAQERADRQGDGQEAEQAGQVQAVPDGGDNVILARPAVRIIARPRRGLQRRATHPEAQEPNQNDDITADGLITNASGMPPEDLGTSHHTQVQSSDSSHRPVMPDRGVIARAVEIRRTLDEHARTSPDRDGPGVQVFKDLWSRAGQNPSEVLRIIEVENRTEELDWIVNFMKKLEGAPRDLRVSAASRVDYLRKGDQQKSAAQHEDPAGDDESFELVVAQSPSASRPKPHSWSIRDLEEPHLPSNTPVGSHAGSDQIVDSDRVTEMSAPASQLDRHLPAFLGPPHPMALSEADGQALKEAIPSETSIARSTSYGGQGGQATPPESPLGESHDTIPDNAADVTPELLPPGQSLLERLMDIMWGGVPLPNDNLDQPAGDEELVVNDIANEAPFVPVAHGQHIIPAQNAALNPAQDPEVAAAAINAGIDPNAGEALDDIEDLEGIMELIGMQGPFVGLIQNGMFCALLISLTMVAALWVPYMFGKFFLTVLDNPIHMLKQPLRFASTSADMVVDFCIFAAGCSFFWVDTVLGMLCAPAGWLIPPIRKIAQDKVLAETAKDYAERALERLARASMANGDFITRVFDVPKFSVVAHESLHDLESKAFAIVEGVFLLGAENLNVGNQSNDFLAALASTVDSARDLARHLIKRLLALLSLAPALLRINPLRINLAQSYRTTPFDYTLAAWNAKDRSIAIICGYLFFALLGAVYLYLAAAVRGTNRKGKVESGIADVLYQAGGVMKVVLIISIEMIVFPLYCGLLLDAALLPLFGNATFISRTQFMRESPNTFLFIHWFIGTCYMFHFALFVSMCRKIMRTGVLFFIRDPDDPTFHPVRDVLERSVSTQLWKISFSALVYGGLVLICLGGVVWGIASVFDSVFPIRWSSNEPVLEFPADLLFYNFLMPVAVKFFRPSAGLTKTYSWWFRKSARWLRLTNFIFGEEKSDEQGRHVRRTWSDWLCGKQGDASMPVIGPDRQTLFKDQERDVYFVQDGKYVLAPSSDQVRIPKGRHTFIELTEEDKQLDAADLVHALQDRNPEQFTKVYIPPLFRVRIGLFVSLIWLFAASTGVAVTIGPLLLGRYIFSNVTPDHLRMNDIYAFSVGIYILAGTLYVALNYQWVVTYIRNTLTPHTTSIRAVVKKSSHLSLRLISLIYTYSALTILLPALVSLLIQCYIIIPLHTHFSAHATSSEVAPWPTVSHVAVDAPQPTGPRPVIHLIQEWTLGILYVRVFARLILWSAPSRPATALRSIIRNGWLDPDIWLATRGFILPASLAMGFLLAGPFGLGWIATKTFFADENDEFVLSCVYRYSYPAVMALAAITGFMLLLAKAFGRWRRRVRDEVYLIGERLHNYGEARRKKKRRDKGKGRERVERPVLARQHTA